MADRKFKLLAFDLDGTLLNSQGQILPNSREAIQDVLSRGVKVVLVTGRHHVTTYPYHCELGLDTPAICCNGTYIMGFQPKKMFYSDPLGQDESLAILEIARKMDMHILIYVRDDMLFELKNAHVRSLQSWGASLPEHLTPSIKHVDDFLKALQAAECTFKFVLSHPDQNRFDQAIETIDQMPGISCVRSWVNRTDVFKSGNSKGLALLRLARQWQIAPDEIIAVGDNDNDISMVSSVGLGVAMAGCTEGLKRVAGSQIGSNDKDSIARLIREYVL
ncbi:MAG: Cof-type HAD-IIB family hydrolase [Endozoicomonas sp.]